MVTCLILAGQIVLTTPAGVLVMPPDSEITITDGGAWGGTGTVISTSWRQITLAEPLADVTAALANCAAAK